MYTLEIKKLDIKRNFTSIKSIKEYIFYLHERYELTGGGWDWNNSYVYKNGKKIGWVSYNGRVWDINNDDKEILD